MKSYIRKLLTFLHRKNIQININYKHLNCSYRFNREFNYNSIQFNYVNS